MITDFRNYPHLFISLNPGRVVFTGQNGSGKTNLLEAISFLSPGKGLRRASYFDISRKGGDGFFSIYAEAHGPFGEIEFGTGTISGEMPGDIIRKTRINQVDVKSSEAFLEYLRVLWLTPAMERLFVGPAADRRRFLDLLVLTVNARHARYLFDYEKAMRNRNRLLIDGSKDRFWFESIEMLMAETATAIAAARLETIRLLSEKIQSFQQEEAFPRALLHVSGSLENRLLSFSAVEVEEAFFVSLEKNRERDRVAGRTLEGPHRSDFIIHHQSKNMPAELSSTGEQKALLIGIVLSHAKLCATISGIVPILILDEVAAHLDLNRRNALFLMLENLGCQTFMTGSESSFFSTLKGQAQFFDIDQGSITQKEL